MTASATPLNRTDDVPLPGRPTAGAMRILPIGSLKLETGGLLPGVEVAYETWGTLNKARDNAVLIEHALTGDSHVVGQAGAGHPTAGWWEDNVGPGKAVDTDRWFVVATNCLGGCRGTTGPGSTRLDGRPYGSRFPFVTIRDMVHAELQVAEALDIERWAAVIGGSMGGMRAIEWAVTHPERVATCVVLASTAYASADQIAWCQPQLLAIRHDPAFHGGDYYERPTSPEVGLGIARRIAHTTYRTARELDDRFGRRHQAGEDALTTWGRYAVESYLDYHAQKLIQRFDANSYLVLTEAMNSHDVGRGRGGVEAALGRVQARMVVGAVDSDRLYPVALSEEIVAGVHGADPLSIITSEFGHDGFLTEADQVGDILRKALDG